MNRATDSTRHGNTGRAADEEYTSPDDPRSKGERSNLLRRVSVGVVDQVLSSGSNFACTVAAAKLLDIEDFGAFSLAMVTYVFLVGLARAGCSEAVLVRIGATDDVATSASAVGSAIACSLLVIPVLLIAAAIGADPLDETLLVLAIALPSLVYQDTLRYVAFARGRPKLALLGDGAWVLSQLTAFVWLSATEYQSAPMVLACWAAPSAIGALVIALGLKNTPSVDFRLSWIRSNRDLSVPYLADFLSGNGASYLAVYAIAAVAGRPAVASIRGAQILFASVAMLQTGAITVLVPEGRRRVTNSVHALRRMALSAGIGFATMGVAALAILLNLPDDLGKSILGETWSAASELFWPVGVAAVISGAIAGPALAMRSLEAAAGLLRVRWLTAPMSVLAPLLGAWWLGSSGAAWGITVAAAWNLVWLAWVLQAIFAERELSTPPHHQPAQR